MKENISLISLGCAKNLVDSEVLIGGLKSENYNLVDLNKVHYCRIKTISFLKAIWPNLLLFNKIKLRVY